MPAVALLEASAADGDGAAAVVDGAAEPLGVALPAADGAAEAVSVGAAEGAEAAVDGLDAGAEDACAGAGDETTAAVVGLAEAGAWRTKVDAGVALLLPHAASESARTAASAARFVAPGIDVGWSWIGSIRDASGSSAGFGQVSRAYGMRLTAT